MVSSGHMCLCQLERAGTSEKRTRPVIEPDAGIPLGHGLTPSPLIPHRISTQRLVAVEPRSWVQVPPLSNVPQLDVRSSGRRGGPGVVAEPHGEPVAGDEQLVVGRLDHQAADRRVRRRGASLRRSDLRR